MPKMKSNRAAKKRFKITASGKVRRSKGGGNHGMQEKSRKRLRRLRNNDMVDKTFEKRIKLMLPYGLEEKETDHAARKTWVQSSSPS
jgi:large subunit ribosomal protein L35